MLKASTRLMPHREPNQKSGIIDELKGIIEDVVRIIQPGLDENGIDPGSEESCLKYALCFTKKEKSLSEDKTSKIYTITSESDALKTEISHNWLIYNLIHGLYDTTNYIEEVEEITEGRGKLNGIQSMLACVKDGDEYVSFKDMYYGTTTKENFGGKSFSDYYEQDCRNSGNETGISILNDAEMCLFFRMARFNENKKNRRERDLVGEAVLVITCKNEAILRNYLDFMSNEKVRLLLLIKEELLDYLDRLMNTDTFIDLVAKTTDLAYKQSLNHMVSNYFKAIESLLATENHLIISLLTTLRYHILESWDEHTYNSTSLVKYDSKKLKEKIEQYMKIPYVADFGLFLSDTCSEPNHYKLVINEKNFKCHRIVYEVVFVEMIINMRRRLCGLDDSIEKEIRIEISDDEVVFTNPYNPDRQPPSKRNGGMAMCNNILRKLGLSEITPEGDEKNKNFKVVVKINKNGTEQNTTY